MADTAIIGRGGIAVTVTTDSSGSKISSTPLRLRYEIYSDRIDFYNPVSSATATNLFTLLEVAARGLPFNATGQGYLNLVSLPAAPKAAFYNVSLSITSDVLTLKVVQPDKFSARANIFFQGLDLKFAEQKAQSGVTVSGTVNAVLFDQIDQPISLSPTISEASGLIFAINTPLSVAIAPLGQLNISTLKVGTKSDRWAELRAFYAFDEPSDSLTESTSDHLFFDSSGSRDKTGKGEYPLDLKLSKPTTVTPLSTPFSNGIAVKAGSDIQSIKQATKLVKACQDTQALTIETWIKPSVNFIPKSIALPVWMHKIAVQHYCALIQALFHSIKNCYNQHPSPIVTLSKDTGECNFTLGQDVDEKDPKAVNFYMTRLYRAGSRTKSDNSDNNGNPSLKAIPESFVQELSHVVFTRNKDGKAQLYVNGIDQTDQKPPVNMKGTFDRWRDTKYYKLALANKLTQDRPWEGEIHQVALYSRALSDGEVFNSYYPAIQIGATLTLDNVPSPFNVPLPVILENNLQDSVLTVTQPASPGVLSFADFFTVEQISLQWRKTAAAMELSGKITATLWGNILEFATTITADRITLSFGAQKTLTLQDLGTIALTQLQLLGDRTIPNSTWAFQTDGQGVTFPTLPPPLRGAFPIQLSLEARDLWLSIDPSRPLILVEGIELSRANLRFKRIQEGWEPQSGQADIILPIAGQLLALTPKFSSDTPKRFLLEWIEDSPASLQGFSGAFGTLLLTHLQLKVGISNTSLWELKLKGRLPLKLADVDELASVLHVALDGCILGDPNNLKKATCLEGTTSLQSLTDLIFTGDLQVKGDRFSSKGQVMLFPDWSLLQVQESAQIFLEADGQMHFQAPMQVTLPDFVLFNPQLVLKNGRLSLNGAWLGEPISFTAIQRANQSIWEDKVQFHLPFSLMVGPIYEPGTTIKLADRVSVCQEPNCRQVMNIATRIELSSSGFLADINSMFQWRDETQTVHDLTIPEVNLFTAPPTRNQILALVIKAVQEHTSEVFATQFKHLNDYFFSSDVSVPVLYFGDRSRSAADIITALPKVFTDKPQPIGDDTSIIQLAQLSNNSQLTLRVTNRSQADIDDAYKTFISALAAREQSGGLLPGAISDIQRRIAERLPTSLDRVLYYHYGFDPAQGYLDLQAGMRLRVDFQNYQDIPPTDKTAKNGFVGSGTSYYTLTSYSYPISTNGKIQYRSLLGFDPFVSNIQSLINTDISTIGASGIVDLLKPGFRQPYYRLFYPKNFAVSSSQPERSILIVGASNLKALQDATDEYQQRAFIQPGNDRVSFFFKGRVVVIPEITVFVQEQPVFVSVGTTFRQLLERFSGIPASSLQGQNLSAFQGRLKPRRVVHDDTTSAPSYKFINFDTYQQYDNGMDVFDLSMVQGDRVYV